MRLAEDGWNNRDPAKVALAYALDSKWRNRAKFPPGREEILVFLTRSWNKELDYRLIKELWAFRDNRIEVRYANEHQDGSGNRFRAYGNENWEIDEIGYWHSGSPASTSCRSQRENASSAGLWGSGRMIIRGIFRTWDCRPVSETKRRLRFEPSSFSA